MDESMFEKFTKRVDTDKVRRAVNKQALILDQAFKLSGNDFFPDKPMGLTYSDGEIFKEFNLYLSHDDKELPVLIIKLFEQDMELNSLITVREIKGKYWLHKRGYRSFGSLLSAPSELDAKTAQFLISQGIPLEQTTFSPYPDKINQGQAILRLLQLMNAKEVNFKAYVEAVQAAAV